MKQQKKDRRSQRTYQLVSSALIALLREKRYDAITVQDILERANIGRSTFYAHYFDKEDVLVSTLEQMIDAFGQHIQKGETGEAKAAGYEALPGLELFRHAQEQYRLYQAFARGQNGEVLWKAMQSLLSSKIERALTGQVPGNRSPSVPLPVMSQYLAGAFLSLLAWWLEAEMPYPPERMHEIFQQLALPGIMAAIGKS